MDNFIHDVSTGETKVEPLTQDDIAFIEASESLRQESELIHLAQQQAKESALSKLSALGLTEEEAKAILGL